MLTDPTITTVIPERTAPLQLFTPLANKPGSVWLDSSMRFGDRGHFSFIARNPSLDVCIHDGVITVCKDGKPATVNSRTAPLDYLENLWRCDKRFIVGYITYEAASSFLRVDGKRQLLAIPEIRFLFYDSVLRYDHLDGSVTVTNPMYDDYSDLFGNNPPDYHTKDATKAANVESTISKSEYLTKVDIIKEHISIGDIYQANFTARFDVYSQSDPFVIYKRLRNLNPSPYGAFLNFGSYRILSSSPERMFKKVGSYISTSPIKGTIERGINHVEEAMNLWLLQRSEKDRAEHVMIVDVERNDLGEIARTGSVKVDEIFKPEVYSSLIHLVSDISAELRPEVGMKDVFRALLPGGSITGAPKKRAAEIIGQLEVTPRSVYTGCIGYIYGNQSDFNIAIRTIIHHGDCYHTHAGGGIVADSEPQAEYQEMLLKACNMFRSLGLDQVRGLH